ncbi:hypothetical protein [uncultured Ruegeria sp.]|nr:hypothetical protein [uncultured Ruegeria sp.]
MTLDSIDENLGKKLKAEKVRRQAYGLKLFIASVVLVAAAVVVVFL